MDQIARESIPVAERHDVYPEIDPAEHFSQKTYQGKVAFITGASRGIGEEIVIMYAKAGASLVLTARKQDTLDAVKQRILGLVPTADVFALQTDVVVFEQVEAAVKAAIARFGRLDFVIANAGKAPWFIKPLGEQDPHEWWDVMEVNLRGTYNTARASLNHLAKRHGYFVAMTGGVSIIRLPTLSSYSISKFAMNRLVEFVHVEYPDIKAFALHPGVVETEMTMQQRLYPMLDTLQLPAATTLYLTSGKADWLSGRYVTAPSDLGELARDWKDKILQEDALVNRLSIPA